MIEQKPLTESQHIHWDRVMDDRALQAGREARILAAMLKELGGDPRDKNMWRFDEDSRTFYRMVADGSTTDSGRTGSADQNVGSA